MTMMLRYLASLSALLAVVATAEQCIIGDPSVKGSESAVPSCSADGLSYPICIYDKIDEEGIVEEYLYACVSTPPADKTYVCGCCQDSEEPFCNSGGHVLGSSASDSFVGGQNGDNDVVYGLDGDDFLYGAVGEDILYGGKGHDNLFGGTGNDILHGGPGDDVLTGGPDNDELWGDEGCDTFVVEHHGSSFDTVKDFVECDKFGFTQNSGISAEELSSTQDGANVKLFRGERLIMILEGASKTLVDAAVKELIQYT